MHAAMVYSSEEDFLAAAVPYLSAGVQAGEHVLAVTRADNDRLLRERLDHLRDRVDFVDAADWYASPGRALHAYDQYVRDHEARGVQVRILGEPLWQGAEPYHRQAWHRYESLLNLAFAGRGVDCVCPYDTRTVGDDVIATAHRTHGTVVTERGPHPSGAYVDPATFCAECDAVPLPSPPVGTVQQIHFSTDLARTRAFVQATAARAGLDPARVSDVVVAVNEVTTNAVRHGGGRGRLRTWGDDHALVFEVDDAGQQRPDPLAGQLPPMAEARLTGGYGLWLARQLCDLVEVRNGPGWVVRLYIGAEAHATAATG